MPLLSEPDELTELPALPTPPPPPIKLPPPPPAKLPPALAAKAWFPNIGPVANSDASEMTMMLNVRIVFCLTEMSNISNTIYAHYDIYTHIMKSDECTIRYYK